VIEEANVVIPPQRYTLFSGKEEEEKIRSALDIDATGNGRLDSVNSW